MSSQISTENNKIEDTHHPASVSQTNSDEAQRTLINRDEGNEKQLNCNDQNEVLSKVAENNKEGPMIEPPDDSILVDEVTKLDLSTEKSTDSNESKSVSNLIVGSVVQNKLSESLSYLQDYNSEDDEGTESDDDIVMSGLQFRDVENDSEDSESNSDTEDYDSMDDALESSEIVSKPTTLNKEEPKSNTSWISDLIANDTTPEVPDISTLELNNKEEFIHIGNVDCVLDKFVTIEGLPSMPAYDLDSLFFVEEGRKVLGYVFDVMGPVASPIYVVHLDSVETAKNLELKKGSKIYCAPKSKYTKIRGSDASWVGDAEVPPEFEEFSDDEQERERKSDKKATKRKHSLERHQKFEASMNKINQINSRLHKIVDSRNPFRQRISDGKSKNERTRNPPSHSATTSNRSEFLPAPRQPDCRDAGLDRSRSLETYIQNCTSQFMQNWTPPLVGPSPPVPQPFYPQDQYFLPPMVPVPMGGNSVPQFNPLTPPPNYCGPPSYSPGGSRGPRNPPFFNSYAQATSSRYDSNLRQNSRPGPSNGR